MNKYETAKEKPLADLTVCERIALAVIDGRPSNGGLRDRGADHFWDYIDDDEDHDEMWDEVVSNIRETLDSYGIDVT